MRKVLANILPTTVTNPIRSYLESRRLSPIPISACDVTNLRATANSELTKIFADEEIGKQYLETRRIVDDLALPEDTGGVNIGDQRALFHLIAHFKPEKVLEIGTFVGCSTVHIALALKNNSATARMKTVDINDVNDAKLQPWKNFSSPRSPYENLVNAKCDEIVTFVHQNSVQYLGDKSGEKFDFIFLDGGHKSDDVYQEVILALDRLQPNGVILLHDYFPKNKPLWELSKKVIPGPYLAMKRLNDEKNKIDVLPLGALPWPTKNNTTVTSLALCSKH